jgi:hypothetical protein
VAVGAVYEGVNESKGGFDEKPSERVARPPESGGQRDRASGEITRRVVPKPHPYKVLPGNLPSRGPFGPRCPPDSGGRATRSDDFLSNRRCTFLHSFYDRAFFVSNAASARSHNRAYSWQLSK